MAQLTDRTIRAAISSARTTGKATWLSESLGRGQGSLTLKVTTTACNWYYMYTISRQGAAPQTDRYPIGPYGDEHFTLAGARVKAHELLMIKREAPGGNLRAYLEQVETDRLREIEGERQAAENRIRQEENAHRYTLEALMDQYVAKMVVAGKTSVQQVRNAIHRHVILSHPEMANMAANEITRGQLTEILRMIVNQGHGRIAAQVRSYIRAAYALALRAESDPTASRDLVNFQIISNPVADIPAMSQFSRARERALSPIELAEFWRSIRTIDSGISRVIQASVLLGGQRITQLLRAERTDYQGDRITLLDPKGRRNQPRTHILPVTPMAAEVLDVCKQNAESLTSRFLFTTHGTRSIALDSVSHWVNDWVKAQSVVAPFSLGDIRRTCETLLASRGVSSDIRAQIQSHGLGGIQARHYDRYEYMDEKRRALSEWGQWIQIISADQGNQPNVN